MVDLYKIIIVPAPVLQETAASVEHLTDTIKNQMDRMLATMYQAPGIGLAANQVGLLNRVIVMDIAQREDPATRRPICMMNPEIVWTSDEPSVWEEGCLSIPGQYAEVQRPKAVRVKYVGYDGGMHEDYFENLGAHCVQHEIDHLNGVLFVDYLSSLKRNMMLKKVEKAQKAETVL